MSQLPRFTFIIGIDQTGAAEAGGQRARPLPCAVLHFRNDIWKLEVLDLQGKPLRLPNFNRECVTALASMYDDGAIGDVPLGQVALAIDCVMGLPEESWPSCRGGSAPLWNLFAQAARSEGGYGLRPAAHFFNSLRLGDETLRACEKLARANSVFNTHPFQKNVQCGTYRIWRDLGSEKLAPHQRWLRFWCFDEIESNADQAWFFESYPSLYWREILGAKTRKIAELRSRVFELFGDLIEIPDSAWLLLERDPNYADAAVLAIGTWFQQTKSLLFTPHGLPRERWLKKEGWIAGLSNQQNKD